MASFILNLISKRKSKKKNNSRYYVDWIPKNLFMQVLDLTQETNYDIMLKLIQCNLITIFNQRNDYLTEIADICYNAFVQFIRKIEENNICFGCKEKIKTKTKAHIKLRPYFYIYEYDSEFIEKIIEYGPVAFIEVPFCYICWSLPVNPVKLILKNDEIIIQYYNSNQFGWSTTIQENTIVYDHHNIANYFITKGHFELYYNNPPKFY